MRRYFLIVIMLSFFGQSGFSINYQSGDELFIWAVSGINLRDTSDISGHRITTIPYGTKVQVKNAKGKLPSLKVPVLNCKNCKSTNAFFIYGHWVKINFNGKEGFIFDGYLSSLPPVKIELIILDSYKEHTPKENLEQWADRNFGILDSNLINLEDGSNKVFKNGLTITYPSRFEQNIFIPNISLQEGFLINNLLYQFEERFRKDKLPSLKGLGIGRDNANIIWWAEGHNNHYIRKVKKGIILTIKRK